MKPNQTEQLLKFCCELGRHLIQNGAEIYRVEESVSLVLRSYGYREPEVFAIPSYVSVGVQDEDRSYVRTARVRSSSNNLDKLERLNALCRQICRETPPVEQAMQQLTATIHTPIYPAWISYLGHGVVAAFFTPFWGGTLLDSVIAFFCGLIVKATAGKLSQLNTNVFFTNICTCVALETLPLLLVQLGLPLHTDMITIGCIMLLVPGIAITNAMRDILAGDFLTALTKCAEVIIVSVAIAVGIAIPIGIFRLFPGVM